MEELVVVGILSVFHGSGGGTIALDNLAVGQLAKVVFDADVGAAK